jgi:chromosome partitioning protein
MTRAYALANQKGGVGKTTTAVNLATYLGLAGRRVLLADMDPQANATSSLGHDKRSGGPSVYDALVGTREVAEVITHTEHLGVDLLPSAIQLAGAEIELVGVIAREARLQRVLKSVRDQYDYLLVDCPPSLGLLTVNALMAAEGVLIPVQCEYLALEGLGQLVSTIDLIRDNLNPRLRVAGVVMTMFDSRTNLSQGVVEEVRQHFPTLTFETIIPRNVRLGEAPSFGRPISAYDPGSRGALAYKALADELIRRDEAAQT